MTPERDSRTDATGDVGRDAGLDRLYREAVGENPPPHVDAAILAAARREVGARPRATPSALRRWRVPVSIAAVVVLSASLVVLVREEGGDPLWVPTAPAPSPAARPSEAVTEPQPTPAPPAAVERSARVPAGQAPGRVAIKPEGAEAGKPAELAKLQDGGERKAPQAPSARTERSAAPVEGASGPQPFSAMPDRSEREPAASGAEPRAAGSPADLSDAGAGLGGAIEDRDSDRARPGREFQDERRLSESRKSAAPAGAQAPQLTRPAPSPGAAAARDRSATPAPGPETRLQAEEMQAAKSRQVARLVKTLDAEPPEKWLARIRELRRDGETADADALLAEFKRRFPNHAVPPDLR